VVRKDEYVADKTVITTFLDEIYYYGRTDKWKSSLFFCLPQHFYSLFVFQVAKSQIFKLVVKINLVICHWNSVISGRISVRSQRTTHLCLEGSPYTGFIRFWVKREQSTTRLTVLCSFLLKLILLQSRVVRAVCFHYIAAFAARWRFLCNL